MKTALGVRGRRRQQPFYASAGGGRGLVVAGQPRQEGLRPRPPDRQGDVEFHHRGTGGCLAGDRRRPRLRRAACPTTANFYVLDLKTGKQLQELELDAAVSGSVAVGPDCILVGTDKGTCTASGKK